MGTAAQSGGHGVSLVWGGTIGYSHGVLTGYSGYYTVLPQSIGLSGGAGRLVLAIAGTITQSIAQRGTGRKGTPVRIGCTRVFTGPPCPAEYYRNSVVFGRARVCATRWAVLGSLSHTAFMVGVLRHYVVLTAYFTGSAGNASGGHVIHEV